MTPTLIEIRLKEEEQVRRMLPAWRTMGEALAEMQKAAALRLDELMREQINPPQARR